MDLQGLAMGFAKDALLKNASKDPMGTLGAIGDMLGSKNGGGVMDMLGGLLGDGAQSTPNAQGFDLSALLGAAKSGNKSAILLALLPVVLGYIQKNGVDGVLQKLGQNPSATQISEHFDGGEIRNACAATGQCKADVESGIAELVPKVLSAIGVSHDANGQINKIMGILKHF